MDCGSEAAMTEIWGRYALSFKRYCFAECSTFMSCKPKTQQPLQLNPQPPYLTKISNNQKRK